jgi:hypothetical protein
LLHWDSKQNGETKQTITRTLVQKYAPVGSENIQSEEKNKRLALGNVQAAYQR